MSCHRTNFQSKCHLIAVSFSRLDCYLALPCMHMHHTSFGLWFSRSRSFPLCEVWTVKRRTECIPMRRAEESKSCRAPGLVMWPCGWCHIDGIREISHGRARPREANATTELGTCVDAGEPSGFDAHAWQRRSEGNGCLWCLAKLARQKLWELERSLSPPSPIAKQKNRCTRRQLEEDSTTKE